jgi:uncharacterized membrane protein YbhN (UPF0104 family)
MQLAGAVARAVRSRLGWDTLGVALSLAIIAAAAMVLFQVLRDVDLDKVWTALRATPVEAIATAGVLIVASYCTLTLYDFFALRTIRQTHIPYRVAAMTGFMSYTVGHNIGATVLTGGAIRYRIYRAWGLNLIDVAKVAFVTGLTFWLGNATVLGIGMAIAPEAASAINQLPPWLNQVIALAALAIIALYLVWLVPRPRVIGRNGWSVTLPSAPLTLVQIGIGIADLVSAGLAMCVLITTHASIDLVTILVTSVLSTLLGFASHAPGSIGVFDAAMLIGLAQIEKEHVLAALLVFRCLYFLLPFCVALMMLAARELWTATKG